MTDYIAQPVVIREVRGLIIEQAADRALINGNHCAMTTRETILANPQHYLRTVLADIMGKIKSGEVAAIVHADPHALGAAAPANGKTTYIMITAEQYAAGAPERARWTKWCSERDARIASRRKAERDFDRVNNEGGEGYNPYRGA